MRSAENRRGFFFRYRTSFLLLFPAYAFNLILLALSWWAAKLLGVPVKFLLRDPLQVLQAPPYIGFLSNVGVLLWAFTAAVLFFSVFLIRQKKEAREDSLYLFFSGLLTSFLLLDDFFLIHEKIHRYLHFPELGFFLIYALFITAGLARFWKKILKTDVLVLFAAFLWLGLSLFLDEITHTQNHLLEDGAKLFGIATWAVYFVKTSYDAVSAR